MAFSLNIFGTSNDDLDSGGSNFEFVLHIIKVVPDFPVTDFDMFVQFFASSWELAGSIPRVTQTNGLVSGVDGRVTNNRPQILHFYHKKSSISDTAPGDPDDTPKNFMTYL